MISTYAVSVVSSPSICIEMYPPSPLVTTGAAVTDSGGGGASYAHAVVATCPRDSPTSLNAVAW